jgi:hypothetical protein
VLSKLIRGAAVLVLLAACAIAAADFLTPHDPRRFQTCGPQAHWEESAGLFGPRKLTCIKSREPIF